MGGFLQYVRCILLDIPLSVSGPYRGMGGFLPSSAELYISKYNMFPAPLEVWVVSYGSKFKVWFCGTKVSGPSRGMGGFLLESQSLQV